MEQKSYEWWNNGVQNKKVYNGETPPHGFEKGYIIVKSKRSRLAKLNETYQKKMDELVQQAKQKTLKRVKKFEDELIAKQKRIYPDL